MLHVLIRRTKVYFAGLSLTTWALFGFLVPFFLFFVMPVFFDPSLEMKFKHYIGALSPIGHDFRSIVADSSAWFKQGVAPVTLYPPLTLLFFWPFTLLRATAGYKILTLIILACYVLTTLFLPQQINKQKNLSALAMFVFLTGLLSYGLQFELERGQWNLIAFTLCLVAVYLFHNHAKLRWLGYSLFTVAVQLKLYPAIFVLALIDDWRDWKRNIRRLVGLGLANLVALFVFGVDPILGMIGGQAAKSTRAMQRYNLAIPSFVEHVLYQSPISRIGAAAWLREHIWLPQVLVAGFFLFCLLFILWKSYMNRSKGFDPYVFMACAIGALVLPSISFDYKLSLLPAAIVLLIPAVLPFEQGTSRFWPAFLTFVFAIAYSCTLYSFTNKPEMLQYNLPSLLIIIGISAIAAAAKPVATAEPPPAEQEASAAR
jgi:hypothetical protein